MKTEEEVVRLVLVSVQAARGAISILNQMLDGWQGYGEPAQIARSNMHSLSYALGALATGAQVLESVSGLATVKGLERSFAILEDEFSNVICGGDGCEPIAKVQSRVLVKTSLKFMMNELEAFVKVEVCQ